MNATVPADRLYWSVIEAPGVRAGQVPEGLWPMIGDEVPVAPEHLWAVGAPVDADRFAVCAIRRADLVDLAPRAVTLIPEGIPDFIPAQASAFNFLIGEHEPRAIRAARLHRHISAAACTILAVVLSAIGLNRRTNAWTVEARAARTAANHIVAAMATRPIWSRDDLALELMQRRQAVPSELAAPGDAAQTLAAIIARWPTQVPSRPQAISATGASASISVNIPDGAQAFLAALKAPEGWTLDEPRLAAIDKATRVNLELRKEAAR